MFKSEIDGFIRSYAGKYKDSVRLAGDASVRQYYRIIADTNYILCLDPQLENIDSGDYAYRIVHDLFSKNGIPVPVVYTTDRKLGALLIQDLGDNLLETVFRALTEEEVKRAYTDAIDILIRIQGIERNPDIIPFSLSFDTGKLMFEFDFFIEHSLLGYFRAEIPKRRIDTLRNEFIKISGLLDRPEFFVLNHRDFHSRNIMIHGDSQYIIDFQDARMGLPQYDLVSLIRDSYIQLDDRTFNFLKDYYYCKSLEAGIHNMDIDEFDCFFDIMAFQRNVKAIGTFGRQITSCGKTVYEKYIRPTADYLQDYADRRPELQTAWEIISYYIDI